MLVSTGTLPSMRQTLGFHFQWGKYSYVQDQNLNQWKNWKKTLLTLEFFVKKRPETTKNPEEKFSDSQ